MKFKEWLATWLEKYVRPSAKLRTYTAYSQTIKLHIVPSLGEYPLSDLTPSVLQGFVAEKLNSGNRKTGNGLSVNTVNSMITILQLSLKTAFLVGEAEDYTADKIKRPRGKEKQVDCFSVSEQKKIEEAALDDKRLKMRGIVICLYTGLRIGELLALEWADVDLDKKLITVSKACYDGRRNGKYYRITDTPKTGDAYRSIPAPQALMPVLRELKRKRRNSEYVIFDGDNKVSVRGYQRSFELLLKRVNVRQRGFHSLRHTFATRALECGMDVKTLSELLGHKNASTTLSRYVHSLLEHKYEMMNMLGKRMADRAIDSAAVV